MSPAAIPAGPSAALCHREGLSAGYHEDPEPAEGKRVEHLKSPTEKARVISGTRETGCGGGGVPLCLWCSKQEHPPLPPQLNDHSVFFFFKLYHFILIYPVCVHIHVENSWYRYIFA